jgi:dihydroorotase
LEHLSTFAGVNSINKSFDGNPANRRATLTAHHILGTINDVLDAGEMGNFCKPVMKEEWDQKSLLLSALFSEAFIFGSDAAPWAPHKKYAPTSCAGCWTAEHLPQLITEAVYQYLLFNDSRGSSGEQLVLALKSFVHDRAVFWWGLTPSQRRIRIFKSESLIQPSQSNNFVPFFLSRYLNYSAEIVRD